MPTQLDIKRRIRSVKNTQQITRAMKFVAAARLRRAQEKQSPRGPTRARSPRGSFGGDARAGRRFIRCCGGGPRSAFCCWW
jgi:F-type H+-transporting ATPase subunit gamma